MIWPINWKVCVLPLTSRSSCAGENVVAQKRSCINTHGVKRCPQPSMKTLVATGIVPVLVKSFL